MFGYCVQPMASGNDSSASSIVLPSFLSYGGELSPEWRAVETSDHRIYFVNHRTRSSHWFPPPEFWTSKLSLPYGWEAALDSQNKKYYINHVTRTTTREDPRSEADQATNIQMTPAQARRIELIRDETIGFGFVAGSEKPVVIRSVIPDGPSFSKLYANDEILKVNGKDVTESPQVDVISLIKSSAGRIELEVIASEDARDTKNKHDRKSSLMSRTRRERRRSTPVSVRFADEPALVQVIDPKEHVRRSSVPLIPNVLKVFLENGQTRSFRYDLNTTTEEIFRSFASKLDLRSMEHFSLVLTGPKKGQISYIQNHEKISEIYTNRNCSSVNCLCKLNIAFVPKDHFELLSQDPNTFEYLYAQVTSMVVEGFYGMDLKYDLAIKLAALEMQQKAIEAAAGRPVKMSVRQIEKEFGGLSKFVPSDLLNNMKAKELRKGLEQQIKHNENLASPGERHMSSLQCKIHYLNLATEIFSYGGRYFDALLVDSGNNGPSLKKSKNQQITVLINLKCGVSQVIRGKVNVLCQLAEFHEIKGFKISRSEDNKRLLCIRLQEGKEIQLICTSLDCTDMIALITGYYKVYVDNTSNTPLPVENEEKWPFSLRRDPPTNDAPEFYSRHHVVPDVWSYPSCFRTFNVTNKRQEENVLPLHGHKDLFLDLTRGPPRYQQTAFTEESAEDHFVAVEVEQKTIDQDSVNKRASWSLNSHLCKDSAEDFDEDDSLDFVLTQDDYSVLEKESFVVKTCTESIDSVTHETQPDVSNGYDTLLASDKSVESCKRRQSSLKISDKEASDLSDIKFAKAAVGDDLQLDEVDLASEQILREEIRENESAGANAFDESEGEVSVSDTETVRSVSTDGSNSERVFSDKSDQINTQAVDDGDEKDRDDKNKGIAGPLYYKHDSSQYRHAKEDDENVGFVDSDLLSRPEPLATDSSISCRNEGTSILSKCRGNNQEFSEEHENLHSHPDQHLFISTDPVNDRIRTTFGDLKCAESTQHNNGIELMDYKEDESGSGGFHDHQRSENCCYFCNTDPGEENLGPKELQLIDREGSENDISNKHQGLKSIEESEPRLVALSEFVESGNSETGSEISDGEESLFSTFPEFFQPSGRVTFSGARKSVLSLAEEDQIDFDMGDLNSMEPDQDLVPVSLINFHSKDDLDTLSPCDDIVDADCVKGWEELSTTSSENTDFSYEVNPEFTLHTSSKDHYSFLNYHKEKQQVFELPDAKSDFTPVSLIPLNDTPQDILLETHSCSSDQAIRKEKSSHAFAADSAVSSDDNLNLKDKDCITDTSKVGEEPNVLLKSGYFNDSSTRAGPSFNQSLRTWMDTGSRFSPSAWIIPSPPTPTPELQEYDIRIVSPPPVDTVTYDDEMDANLEHLIVRPPPLTETFDTISNIRIASHPPSPSTQIVTDSDVIDDFVCDYSEVRFLSLTDDHKLAHNKGMPVNFSEDRKIQAQNVEANGLFVSKGNFHASKSAPLICGTYTDGFSTKSYSMAPLEHKPPVPPKPLYLPSTSNESRARECDAISYKDMDASSNAKRVVKQGGIINMVRTRHEPGQSLNPLHAKAGHSFSFCQIDGESFFKDSNNNDESLVQSQSGVQASSNVLVDVKESDPSGDLESSERKAEMSLHSVVEGDSMSAAKGRSPAFHRPCVFSAALVTSKDLLTRRETGGQGDTSEISSGLKLLHRSQTNSLSCSLTSLQHPSTKKDAYRSLPNKHSVDLDKGVNDNLLLVSIAPRVPDIPPPPLPETSPPKAIVDLNYDDFDFEEPLSDTYEDYKDYAQGYGDRREENSFDRPSSARELKSKSSLENFSRKRDSSINSLLKTEEKNCTSTYYITPSSLRGVSRRSLSEDNLHLEDEMTSTSVNGSQNEKLSDISDSRLDLHFLQEHQTNSVEAKCSKVFEEALSRVGSFRKRLESFLTEDVRLKSPVETTNWLLVLQNNARFLACDVKVIVSSARRGSGQVLSAIQASLESLEKLIEACEKAKKALGEYSTYNFRTLVSTMIEIVEHYGDVIGTVKSTTHDQPNNSDLESLNDKANVLKTLIASLIRKIRKS